MLTRVRTAVTCALLVLLTAGCAAESDTPLPAPSPAGSTPTAFSSVATTTGDTPTLTVTTAARPTTTALAGRLAQEAVKAATLTAADLPGNDWVAEGGESLYRIESKSSNPPCETRSVLTSGPQPAAKATYAFSVVLAPGVEYVDGVALAYRDEAAAAAAVTHFLQMARSCRSWKSGGLDGGGFLNKQSVERAPWDTTATLIRSETSAVGMADVPAVLGATAVSRKGMVVSIVRGVFPPGTDRGVVGLRELSSLSDRLASRGART